MASTLIPVVAGIHYDDIAKLFRLKVSLELMSPLGNKRVEEVFTLASLAEVIVKIAEVWALSAGHTAEEKVGFVIGEWPVLGATIAGYEAPSYNPPTLPTPYSDHFEFDSTGWTPPTDWGETGP